MNRFGCADPKKGFPMHHCYQPTRHGQFTRKCRLTLAVASLLPALLSGCVALGIPSVRYHDPDDRGGILGPHLPATATEVVAASEEQVFVDGSGEASSCAGCGDEYCEGECEGGPSEKPPEVPWPRFHPLPTRPVFTSPQG